MTELRSTEYQAWAATGDTAADYWRLGGVCKRKKHECKARANERRERQEAEARAARAAPRPDAGAAWGGPGRAPPGRAQPAAQAAPPPASPHRQQLQKRIEAAKAENEKLRGQLQKADEARVEPGRSAECLCAEWVCHEN